jgi:hypothetical protein
MNEYDTIMAVLTAGAPPEDLSVGVLDVSPGRALMHLNGGTCATASNASRSRPMPLRDLLELVDGKQLTTCAPCLLASASAPVTSWKSALRLSRLTAQHLVRVDRLETLRESGPGDNIDEYARHLVWAAGAFSEDTSTPYLTHRGWSRTWYSEDLRVMHERLWDDGKTRFDALVHEGLVSSHLKVLRPRRADTLVVACKGGDFVSRSVRDNTQLSESFTYAAMLEGPRLGQTADWFVTPATWAPGQSPTRDIPKTLTLPPGSTPEAVTAGLGLWGGGAADELSELIKSASQALLD